MKSKLTGSILLFCAVLIWWRTGSTQDGKTLDEDSLSKASSTDLVVPSEPAALTRSKPRGRLDRKDLRDALEDVELAVSADRIGANSAEGSVLLRGMDGVEITTEEAVASPSSGGIILSGPTEIRSSHSSLKVEGEESSVRISPDGMLKVTGRMEVEIHQNGQKR